MSDYTVISQNVPEASMELIVKTYQECNSDVMATITKLLDLEVPIEKPKTEWDIRRETYDYIDAQMQNHLKQLKNNGYQDENGVLKVPVISASLLDKNLSVNPVLKK
uniref:Uncharacterized protein n=1 Tax=viral metagenome TaxID=1070528 RepID=A0A6C0CRX3_9ZZZZ